MLADKGETIHRLTRGRPRTDPALRRTHITKTAEHVFVEDGYTHSTMEHVATRAFISKATLYAAFPSKRDLFAAVVEARSSLTIPDNISGDLTVAQMLEAMLLPEAGEHGISDRNRVVRSLYKAAHEIPELWNIFRSTLEAECRKLADWLLTQQSNGLVVVEDAMDAARLLINVALGYPSYHLDAVEDPLARSSYIHHCITLFCRGITPPSDR
jgi:TetR/AcrR family transcriptional repressor of mexJK operon